MLFKLGAAVSGCLSEDLYVQQVFINITMYKPQGLNEPVPISSFCSAKCSMVTSQLQISSSAEVAQSGKVSCSRTQQYRMAGLQSHNLWITSFFPVTFQSPYHCIPLLIEAGIELVVASMCSPIFL